MKLESIHKRIGLLKYRKEVYEERKRRRNDMSNSKKKQTHRFVSMLLTLSLVITTVCVPLPGLLLDTYASDQKEASTESKRLPQPVQEPEDERQIVKITDESQLSNTKKGIYYQLQNDIISTGTDENFQGILDGNGHTITLKGKHLFNRVEKDGIVQNVHFSGTVGEQGVEDGPLGEVIRGAVLNCSSAVTGANAVGFAKQMEGGILSNCIAYGKAEKGAILSIYGKDERDAKEKKALKGKIVSTYWIPTDKDPLIDEKDLLEGSTQKTEAELKSKELVKILNENKGTYGTTWGQNGTTGYPYFGEDQTYQPEETQGITPADTENPKKVEETKSTPIQTTPVKAKEQQNPADILEMVKKGKDAAAKYLLDQHKDQGYQYGNEWEIFSLLRGGYSIPEQELEAYYQSVVKEVKTWNETVKPTDVERVLLTLLIMKKDITNIEGINLASFISDSPKLAEGSNELCWALLAFDANGTNIPKDAVWTRENIVAELLKWQNEDGGFPLFLKGESGIDTTAMVLQSLVPYQEQTEVKETIDKGLTYLSNAIGPTFDGGNTQATAQVLLTLSVLGRDASTDKEFSTKENNLVMSLLTYLVEGEGFQYTKDSKKANPMANIQALQALDAYEHFATNQDRYWNLPKVEENKQPQSQQELQVKPKPAQKDGKVVVSVERFTIGQGYFKEPVLVSFQAGETGLDLLKKVIGASNYVGEDTNVQGIKGADEGSKKIAIPAYITKMGTDAPTTESVRTYYEEEGKERFEAGTLGESTYFPSSGWRYTVNGASPMLEIGAYEPKDGDVVRFQYTLYGQGADLTGIMQGEEQPSVVISDKNPLTKLLAEVNEKKEELLKKKALKEAYNRAMELMPDMTAPQEKVDAAMETLQEALKKEEGEVKPENPQQPEQSETPEQPQTPDETSYVRPVVLTDQHSGIILTGHNLERSMSLQVTPLTNTDKQVELMQNEVSKAQWIVRLNQIQLTKNGTEITDHGTVTLYLPLSKIYTGSRMTVIHCVNGKVEFLNGEVIDGFVKIEVPDLQGFGIIIEPSSMTGIYKKIV